MVSAAVALLAETADGGVVVVGDVRCLRLLGAFHRAVQAYRNPEASAADVAHLADAAALSETQLCVHPHWWASLSAELAAIDGVRVLPKRGAATNELTQYRYDVLIHVRGTRAAKAPPPPPCDEFSWEAERGEALRARVAAAS